MLFKGGGSQSVSEVILRSIVTCSIASLWWIGAVNPSLAAIEYADIAGGRVQGEVEAGLASFKGLPFAAPPLAGLRWRAPQPVVAWSGVRKADTFARACIQPWGDGPEPKPSEDCLYLNVWTAAAAGRTACRGRIYRTARSWRPSS